jgi:hypothetical protein
MPLQVRWFSHPPCVIMRPAFAAAGFAALFTISSSIAHAQGAGREETEFKWSRRLEAGATLVIRSGDGPIAVHESSSDRVEITAVKRVRGRSRTNDVGFDIVENGNQVEICTLYGRQESCRDRDRGNSWSENIRVSVEFTVNLPRGARLRAATGNGRIDIDRGSSDVSATTGNGAISIGETSGRVDATTGNGDVQVDGANGPVSVTTGNGRVFVLTARGAVDATTGNGDIDVRIKSGPIERDMKFSTGSGSIRIGLPQDFNGNVDATSGTGSLRTDFDIAVIGRLDAHHVRGTIGRGGPQIRLITGSGTIELRKGT